MSINRIQIQLFHDHDARRGASIAIEHRLHHSDATWTLRHRLISVQQGDRTGVVAIASNDDGEPVGVVLVRLNQYRDVAAFVKNQYRRQGLGTQMINKIKQAGIEIPAASTGIIGSHHFWQRNSIPCQIRYLTSLAA